MDSPTDRIPRHRGGSWRDQPLMQSVSGSTVGGSVEQHSYGDRRNERLTSALRVFLCVGVHRDLRAF